MVFTAYPWAEIQIDGAEPFLTPRAEPVELAPGSHQLVLRHRRYGEVKRTLVVAAGQKMTVRHVFTEAERK